jgi:Na+/phosphate symporter
MENNMSETDIRNLEVNELRDLIVEYTIKINNFEQAKKDYVKALGEMIKTNQKQLDLCVEVLSAKDSDMARRLLVETTQLLPT